MAHRFKEFAAGKDFRNNLTKATCFRQLGLGVMGYMIEGEQVYK
jgi:hypothetical protein